jgi:hypothetical protein
LLTVEVVVTTVAGKAVGTTTAGCDTWLFVSGLQALTTAATNTTPVRANRILRRRFMLISLCGIY